MVTRSALTQPTQTLAGIHDDLDLYADRLVIRHKDMFSTLFRGDQTIYWPEITAVHLYECRFESLGKLRFDFRDHSRDAVIIEFRCDHHAVAAAIKTAVEAALQPPA